MARIPRKCPRVVPLLTCIYTTVVNMDANVTEAGPSRSRASTSVVYLIQPVSSSGNTTTSSRFHSITVDDLEVTFYC